MNAREAPVDRASAFDMTAEVPEALPPHAAPHAPKAAPEPAPVAPPGGRAEALARLHAELERAPWEHDFHALLRRLEALHPHLPRLGRALRPSQEALRLGQDPELDFAPAAVSSFEPHPGGGPPRLGVRFFGLLGPQGPLPLHLTEHVRERLRYRGDPTTARFLDIFHHRLLTLYYRVWADSQPVVQQDRPGEDRYAVWLGASFGAEPPGLALGRLPPSSARFQAGLLASRSRHPEGLEKLVGLHFGVAARIEANVPHWLAVEPEDRTRLGRRAGFRTPGSETALGRGAMLGSRRPDRQTRFRIVLSGLTHRQHTAFLPPGRASAELAEWVHRYTGLDLQWDLQLELRPAERPEPELRRRVRLGIDAWLGRRPEAGASRPAALPQSRHLRLRPGLSFLHRDTVGNHHA